ncbi:unnamed protein product [Amoebophrya sp. A120]|nr:unnamed protein product [Amoebophrya sp. A120]|eukprot:GSA120T00007319001.1
MLLLIVGSQLYLLKFLCINSMPSSENLSMCGTHTCLLKFSFTDEFVPPRRWSTICFLSFPLRSKTPPPPAMDTVLFRMNVLWENHVAANHLKAQRVLLLKQLSFAGLSPYAVNQGMKSYQETGSWAAFQKMYESGMLAAFEKCDCNGSGVLERAEGGNTCPAEADLNQDGRFSVIELHDYLIPSVDEKQVGDYDEEGVTSSTTTGSPSPSTTPASALQTRESMAIRIFDRLRSCLCPSRTGIDANEIVEQPVHEQGYDVEQQVQEASGRYTPESQSRMRGTPMMRRLNQNGPDSIVLNYPPSENPEEDPVWGVIRERRRVQPQLRSARQALQEMDARRARETEVARRANKDEKEAE